MVVPEGANPVVLGIGLLAAVAIGWYVYRDAGANDVSRAWLWAALSGSVFLAGVWLFEAVGAPLSGSIITANTGLVLYGFEREIANEDAPGRQPTGEPFREE